MRLSLFKRNLKELADNNIINSIDIQKKINNNQMIQE